jgi:hypothetical protein
MDHKVWNIFIKDKYTEEGVKRIEQIYDFIEAMIKQVGILQMKELFNMWNENSDETFWILDMLTHPDEE